MIIYPAIEIYDGRPVSLFRGRIEEPQIWHVDPIAKVREFAAAGAEWIHITDFDAVQGSERNTHLIEEIIQHAHIPVQLGGGFRTAERVEHWIGQGAGRVVIGTLAAQDPRLAKRLARLHPDQIVLAVDVWKGQIMTEGWRKPSALTPAAFIKGFRKDPFAAIIVTDIDADIGDTERSLSLISALAAHSRTPVIASGLVRDVDDVSRLKFVPGVSGAIIGRALFNKTIKLDEAIGIATAMPEKVAEFR